LLAVLAVRLPFLFGGVSGGDAAYHARAAVVVLNRGVLYSDVPYTYPPLYAYTEALSIALLGNTDIGWKTAAQIYDLASVVLIFLITSRISGRNKGLVAAALYGFSPLPLFATSTFVTFDSTAAFWMLASILLLLGKRAVPSAVALGIGTAYKYFPLLLLPPFLIYLAGKRAKLLYAATSIATVAVVQLPFLMTEFSPWINNVILYHLDRSASGATIYNLLSLHPNLWDAQTPLTLLSPVSLLLVFSLIALDRDNSEYGLLKKTALVMVAAVFFNKVVLFYALWFIPLLCTVFVALRKRTLAFVVFLFFTLQVAILLGWYAYDRLNSEQGAFAWMYLYLLTSGLLLLWLLRDRLLSAVRTFRKTRQQPLRNV
jgi:uncharacterized membrane protein